MEGDAFRLGEMPDGRLSQRERELLAPRKYQLEILEEAKKRNTIAYLETGTGKTLISVLLIKALSAELRRKDVKKLTAFIVPLVPLVHQQAEVIRVHTDLRVGQYYGDLGVDFWKAERWAEEIEKNQVLVCTAQVLLNALRHGFLSMALLRLLIVDECHHAHGRHPYRQIMNEFYHTADAAARPAVFGMTASPINTQGVSDVEACARQLATLERTLDATIFALEDRDCVEQFAPTPNEIVLHYDSEGVVDAGLMKRLQRLISKAEKASSEARKQALRNEDQNVTTTIEKEERGVAVEENVDGRSGQMLGKETVAGREVAAEKDTDSAAAHPRSSGQTKAEAEVAVEAAGKPGESALARGLRKEGEGGGSPSLETGLVGEELEKGEDGEEEAEVWRGARPISVEAGKIAAKLLARVKHTWEELGQFCAFKAAERLLAQLSEEETMDELGFQGFNVGEAQHERAVQRWFLNQARQLLEGDARDLQEAECDLPALIEGGLLSPKVAQLLRQLTKYHSRNRRHIWAALCRRVQRIRTTPEPEDAQNPLAAERPSEPGTGAGKEPPIKKDEKVESSPSVKKDEKERKAPFEGTEYSEKHRQKESPTEEESTGASHSETVDSEDRGEESGVVSGEEQAESAKCIVFVSRVLTAHVLTDLLTTMTSMGGLRAAALTGHSKWSRNVKTQIGTSATDAQIDALEHAGSMNSREQQRIIARFQTGHVSLLFATDVAEEGLDIQRCNSVIRFDLPTTVRGHIQSRGRARRPGSDYVLMVERHNDAQEAMLVAIQASEALIRKQAEERMAREDVEGCLEASEIESYIVEGTGARASSDSAVGLLHRYCAKLPGDQFTVLRPQFKISEPSPGRFSCDITLPINARIRNVAGPERATKQEAKRAAAMEAIRQLHKYKALTDRLLPTTIMEDEEIPARRPFRFTRWHYPAPKPNLPVYDEERPSLLSGKWLGQSKPREPPESSTNQRSGTSKARTELEATSLPQKRASETTEEVEGKRRAGLVTVTWGSHWGFTPPSEMLRFFEEVEKGDQGQYFLQLKASLGMESAVHDPVSGIPSQNMPGSSVRKDNEESFSKELDKKGKGAADSVGGGEPVKGRNVVGQAEMNAGKKEIYTPASKQPGQSRLELPGGTANQAAGRKSGTASDQDAKAGGVSVHSYSITFRSAEVGDPLEADAGGFVLLTEKNMDAVLPLEVELFLPRGEETETVTGKLGPGGRQYLSRSELEAARQYHVKLMGWVLDWEHVTPLVEPYWSPEKAYLIVPLKEERDAEDVPRKATGDFRGVRTDEQTADGTGRNGGKESNGVEIDWAVIYDAVRPVKEPTPLADEAADSGSRQGLGASDDRKSSSDQNMAESGEEASSSQAKNGPRHSKSREETKDANADTAPDTRNVEGAEADQNEPPVSVEWVAPGQLMTADGLVDVSELRSGETMVTAIHTRKEYRVHQVLEGTCLDSPFIYRHREERREWATFSEYYRTKRKLLMEYPRQPLLQCKPLQRAKGLLNPHRDPYKWAPQNLSKLAASHREEAPSTTDNPSAAEKQTVSLGDAPGSGEPRDDAYDEGQAVAEAAALLKSDFEKKEELNSEQEAETTRLNAAGDKESRRLLEVPAELCVVRRGSPARLHCGAQRLPSFLHRLEETLVAEKLRRKIGSKVHASKILEALTATSCSTGYSYERLEMLGDAYLKYAVRRHLFFAHPEQHEGWLTATFDTTVSNDALYARALERGLQGFLLTKPFDLRNWHAAGRVPPRGKPKREKKKRVPRYKKWQKMREEAAAARACASETDTTSGVPKAGEKEGEKKGGEMEDTAGSKDVTEGNGKKRKSEEQKRSSGSELDAKKRKDSGLEKLGSDRNDARKTDGGEFEERKPEERKDGNVLGVEGLMDVDLGAKIAQGVGSPDFASRKASAEMAVSDSKGFKRATLVEVETAKTRGHDQDEAPVGRNEYEAAIEEAELNSEEEAGEEELEEEDDDEEEEGRGADNETEERREEGERRTALEVKSTNYDARFPTSPGGNGKAKGTGLETIPEIEEGEGETGGLAGRVPVQKRAESGLEAPVCLQQNERALFDKKEVSEAFGKEVAESKDGRFSEKEETAKRFGSCGASDSAGRSPGSGGQSYGGARRAAVGRARLNSRQGFGGTAGTTGGSAAQKDEQREGFGDFVLGGQVLGRKLLADMVEALIGVHHQEGGPQAAEDFMRYMGLPVDLPPGDITDTMPYKGMLDVRVRAPPEATALEASQAGLENLEETIGYRFKRPSLLLEAMTHPSYMETSHVACYQRLEFLGDALIDWIITRHFFESHKDISPGVLTYLRQAAVNNERFARLCLRFGFQQHLRHGSSDLLRHVTEFARVAALERDPDLGSAAFGIATVHAPKVLGDLVESVAAAVLLDAELDHDQVWKVFQRLMQPIVTPETLRVHPVRELQERVQRRSLDIEYVSAKVGTMFKVDILLDGERVATGTGMKVDAARKVAAKKALDYLQSLEEAERREGRALADLSPEERKRRRSAIRLKLREECIRRGWPRPRYFEVVKEGTAPSFRYGYEARVIFEDQTVACAAGDVLPSLKRAKQSAALLLLQKLRDESVAAVQAV